MFKKLRNNFLAVSCALIGALIICCFGTNYFMVYQGTRRMEDKRLDNEIRMTERRVNQTMPDTAEPPDGRGADGRRDDGAPRGGGDPLDFGKNQSFSPTFSIVTDGEGAVTDVTMAFTMTEDFYTGIAPQLIASGKNDGRFRSENSDGTASNWRYAVKKNGGGYIIAFTEVSADAAALRMHALYLLLIALAAMVGAFFISLFFANRSIKPIEDAYNKQKQFVADASHELRTPLSAINTNADVLLSKGSSTIDEEKKWLLYIKDEAKRMSRLTSDLLYLARADYGDDGRTLGSVSWTEVVNHALLVMEARAFESGAQLTSSVTDEVNVTAGEEQLKQLVMILLDNALKYTPDGGKISVSLTKKGAEALLTVTNTGEGIAPEDLPHIFDRFYRSDKARTYTDSSGYGLGLAIAKATAESFKGGISAQSRGGVTTFCVRLPAVQK